MWKSEVTEAVSVSSDTYPAWKKLKDRNRGLLLVLFYKKGSGIVMHNTNPDCDSSIHQIGISSNYWDESKFEDFHGEIKITV